MTRNPRAAALLALIGLSLIWSYNYVVMKQVLAYTGPFAFTALRAVLGAGVLFVLLVVLRRPLRPSVWGPLVVLGLLQTGAFMALLQWALVEGGAGKTAVLIYTMPFWLLLLAWPLLGERLRGGQWLAVGLAAGGLVAILGPGSGGTGTVQATLIALVAGLVWAACAVVAKQIQTRHPMDLLTLTAWQMLFGAAALCLIAPLVPERAIEPTPYFYGALAYNALGATALAWLLWLFALRHLPAGVAGLTSLATPALGVLFAWLLLGEAPSAAEWFGMALIAAALALLSTLALRRRQDVRPAQDAETA